MKKMYEGRDYTLGRNYSQMRKDRFKRKELDQELSHETNNYEVAINGRPWKVFGSMKQAESIAANLRKKGKDAKVHETSAAPSNQVQSAPIQNNYEVSINGRPWKVFGSQNHAENVARKLIAKGTKATTNATDKAVSESANITRKNKMKNLGEWLNEEDDLEPHLDPGAEILDELKMKAGTRVETEYGPAVIVDHFLDAVVVRIDGEEHLRTVPRIEVMINGRLEESRQMLNEVFFVPFLIPAAFAALRIAGPALVRFLATKVGPQVAKKVLAQGVKKGATQAVTKGVTQAATKGVTQAATKGATQAATKGATKGATQAATKGATATVKQNVQRGVAQALKQGKKVKPKQFAPTVNKITGNVAKGAGKAAKSPGKIVRGAGKVAKSPGKIVRGAGKATKSPGKIVRGTGKVASGAGSIVKGTGKFALKNPGLAITTGVGAYAYKKIGDLYDGIMNTVEDVYAAAMEILDDETLAMIAKYGIPAAAVAAIVFGGYGIYKIISGWGDDDDDPKQKVATESFILWSRGILTEDNMIQSAGSIPSDKLASEVAAEKNIENIPSADIDSADPQQTGAPLAQQAQTGPQTSKGDLDKLAVDLQNPEIVKTLTDIMNNTEQASGQDTPPGIADDETNVELQQIMKLLQGMGVS